MLMSQILKDLRAVIFPELCMACNLRLGRKEELLCLKCLTNLPVTNFHKDADNPVSKIFFGRAPLHFAAAFLYYSHKGSVQRMIHKLKYKGVSEMGILLGKLYGYELSKTGVFQSADYIVPVPLHPDKLKKRGYNQSEVIARGLSMAMKIPVDAENLYRNVYTETQTKKTKYKRWENVDSIFCVKNPDVFTKKHLILVDDVITTGATIEACAQELLRIEGCTVSIVAVATAMRM